MWGKTMKPHNPHLPPTHPANAAASTIRPRTANHFVENKGKEQPLDDYIIIRLPRSQWAEAVVRVSKFLAAMDALAECLSREGDTLSMSDVQWLAKRFLTDPYDGAPLLAEIILMAMSISAGFDVLHTAQCDADKHGLQGDCEWRRKLRDGTFIQY